MGEPKITLQKRIIAQEGTSIAKINRYGSDGQKIAAPLFDYDDNGKLEGKEVTNFNNYRFKIETDKKSGINTLTLSRWVHEGLHFMDYIEKQLDRTTVIKYKSKEQLYNTKQREKYPGTSAGNHIDYIDFPVDLDFGNGSSVNINSPYKRAEIDMIKNKVLVDGMEQQEYNRINVDASNIVLTVKNSDISNVVMVNGTLKLENTKSYGFYEKPVDVATNGVNKVKVQKDAQSKAHVFTWSEIAH